MHTATLLLSAVLLSGCAHVEPLISSAEDAAARGDLAQAVADLDRAWADRAEDDDNRDLAALRSEVTRHWVQTETQQSLALPPLQAFPRLLQLRTLVLARGHPELVEHGVTPALRTTAESLWAALEQRVRQHQSMRAAALAESISDALPGFEARRDALLLRLRTEALERAAAASLPFSRYLAQREASRFGAAPASRAALDLLLAVHPTLSLPGVSCPAASALARPTGTTGAPTRWVVELSACTPSQRSSVTSRIIAFTRSLFSWTLVRCEPGEPCPASPGKPNEEFDGVTWRFEPHTRTVEDHATVRVANRDFALLLEGTVTVEGAGQTFRLPFRENFELHDEQWSAPGVGTQKFLHGKGEELEALGTQVLEKRLQEAVAGWNRLRGQELLQRAMQLEGAAHDELLLQATLTAGELQVTGAETLRESEGATPDELRALLLGDGAVHGDEWARADPLRLPEPAVEAAEEIAARERRARWIRAGSGFAGSINGGLTFLNLPGILTQVRPGIELTAHASYQAELPGLSALLLKARLEGEVGLNFGRQANFELGPTLLVGLKQGPLRLAALGSAGGAAPNFGRADDAFSAPDAWFAGYGLMVGVSTHEFSLELSGQRQHRSGALPFLTRFEARFSTLDTIIGAEMMVRADLRGDLTGLATAQQFWMATAGLRVNISY